MKVEFFVLCKKEIQHHSRVAFHRGHVYIGEQTPDTFVMLGDDGSIETFPEEYFKEHFKIIFPVMEDIEPMRRKR